jgi:hypothetical protein
VARPTAALAVGPDDLVSMNAWGFRPTFWSSLDAAVTAAAGDERQELLLPAVVAALVDQIAVEVVPVDDRCLSITWAGDLATVRQVVSESIAAGQLPERLGRPAAGAAG